MKLVLIDVDDTLYPRGTGPFSLVNEKIDDYVMVWCRIGLAKAKELRKEYIGTYGSTLGGLMRHHGVDPEHYLKAVHDVPVEAMLTRDDRLKDALAGIQGEKVIFSNGSAEYVRRVLDALGVSELFRDLFTIEFMDYIPKPRTYPYRKVLELYGRMPSDCILIDDRIPNIRTAMEMGMETVLVGAEAPEPDTRIIPDIYAIPHIFS